MLRKTLLASVVLAAGVIAASAQAATITPTVVGYSSNYDGYPAADAVDKMEFTDWAANSTGSGSYINLDLGGNFALTAIDVVDRLTSGGDNGTDTRGTTDFTTSFSLTSYSDNSFTTSTGSATFSKPTPTTDSDSAFGYHGATNLQGEFFRYAVLAANGPNPGLNNVQFEGSAISAAPEPGAWALMLGGLGAMGLALRSRRRRSGAALTAAA